jgi:hypothetical protein
MERTDMSCCGQKRQAWRQSNLPKIEAVAPPPTVPQFPVILRHLGNSSFVIKGEVTGHTYLFAGGDQVLTVDERDVPALLATGQFEVPKRCQEQTILP